MKKKLGIFGFLQHKCLKFLYPKLFAPDETKSFSGSGYGGDPNYQKFQIFKKASGHLVYNKYFLMIFEKDAIQEDEYLSSAEVNFYCKRTTKQILYGVLDKYCIPHMHSIHSQINKMFL